MKSLITLSIFLASAIFAFSKDYMPTVEELEAFLKTKTLVVLEDNPMLEYNFDIQDVVKANWTITPYEFISIKEFHEKFMDPQYSFLIMNQVQFDKDDSKPEYNFLSVWLGSDKIKDYEYLPEICGVPLSYKSVDESSYLYKLGTLIRFMQNHIQLIYKNPDLISPNIFKHYNDNMGDIKEKTLYLVKDDLQKSINTTDKIKKVYPYKVKITTKDVIKEAIKNKDKDVVFLHKIGPEGTLLKARCYKMLVGAADANFYYFDMHMINDKSPDGLLLKDLKKIVKQK